MLTCRVVNDDCCNHGWHGALQCTALRRRRRRRQCYCLQATWYAAKKGQPKAVNSEVTVNTTNDTGGEWAVHANDREPVIACPDGFVSSHSECRRRW